MTSKYNLTNITRKKDPKTARERVGYLVGVLYTQAGKSHEITLPPGRSTFTEILTEAHLKLAKAGCLSIKEVEDISVLLKEHTTPVKKVAKKVAKKVVKKGTAISMGEASKKASETVGKEDPKNTYTAKVTKKTEKKSNKRSKKK